jgi:hypothetical protein
VTGDLATATSHLTSAIAELKRRQAPAFLALAELELARVRLAAEGSDPADAETVELLGRAAQRAADLGLHVLATRIAALRP